MASTMLKISPLRWRVTFCPRVYVITFRLRVYVIIQRARVATRWYRVVAACLDPH